MTTTTTTGRYIYRATAWYHSRPAGHVCYGRTKEQALMKARRYTSLGVIITRERATEADIAALVAVGKLERG